MPSFTSGCMFPFFAPHSIGHLGNFPIWFFTHLDGGRRTPLPTHRLCGGPVNVITQISTPNWSQTGGLQSHNTYLSQLWSRPMYWLSVRILLGTPITDVVDTLSYFDTFLLRRASLSTPLPAETSIYGVLVRALFALNNMASVTFICLERIYSWQGIIQLSL